MKTTLTIKKLKELFSVSNGNRKLKSTNKILFQIFNLPCRLTCPFATKNCLKKCYARKAESNPKTRDVVVKARHRNLDFSKSPDFVPYMVEYLRIKLKNLQDGRKIVFRIHESGDFYSEEYADKWIEISNCFADDERISFTAYTKSIVFFKGKTHNINLRFSVWDDTAREQIDLAKEMGLPIYTAVKCFSESVTYGNEKYEKYFKCRCSDCATCLVCYSDKVKIVACEIH